MQDLAALDAQACCMITCLLPCALPFSLQVWHRLAAADVSAMVNAGLSVQEAFEEVCGFGFAEDLSTWPQLLAAYEETKTHCVAAVDDMHRAFQSRRPAASTWLQA
jgi:hypothetical protein